MRFRSVGLNLYRDGDDSVAWHGDRVARDRARGHHRHRLAGRAPAVPPPAQASDGPGPSVSFAAGNGDLLVMGGSCQRTWQHSVPKVRRAGPRISVTFRHELLTRYT